MDYSLAVEDSMKIYLCGPMVVCEYYASRQLNLKGR
jgi:hypothetical protein